MNVLKNSADSFTVECTEAELQGLRRATWERFCSQTAAGQGWRDDTTFGREAIARCHAEEDLQGLLYEDLHSIGRRQ